ncbi:fungal-specific transcription factor domain-containing protein [Xylogone sp. PMI_703]|nr:fungal-specific transcription factor domain-containing protein [Xylogone sp. PMI_703]
MVIHADKERPTPRKRKPRRILACEFCRQQKQKCDFESPCQRCRSRGHPELCSLLQQDSRAKSVLPSISNIGSKTPPLVTNPLVNAQSPIIGSKYSSPSSNANSGPYWTSNNGTTSSTSAPSPLPPGNIAHVQNEVSPRSRPGLLQPCPTPANGICQVDEMTGGLVFFGAKSRAVTFQHFWERNAENLGYSMYNNLSMISVFDLSNSSAAYPFPNLWNQNTGILELYNTIPTNVNCMGFYRSYRDHIFPFYPSLIDVDEFESTLCDFLIARESQLGNPPRSPEETVHGRSWTWIGLLFAVLSCGCQFSDLPSKDRELTSKVLTCCSFECLRMENLFLRPTLETIQTLLMLGSSTKNNKNPGISWSLLGLTIRLAQGLGLHTSPEILGMDPSTYAARRSLWNVIAWQDCTLALAYGRDPSTTSASLSILPLAHKVTGLSYTECITSLCATTVDMLHNKVLDMSLDMLFKTIPTYQSCLDQIRSNAKAHLQDKNLCKSLRHRLEHLAFRLHLSYITSELYRSALHSPPLGGPQQEAYANICVENLKATIEASIELHRLSTAGHRMWEFSYPAMSSALFLGAFAKPYKGHGIDDLITRLINTFSDTSLSTIRDIKSFTDENCGPNERALWLLRILHKRNAIRSS